MDVEEFHDLPDNIEDDDQEEAQKLRPYLEDTKTQKKYPIPTYPIVIGREKKNAICIPVPAISRRHAKIFEEKGYFYIQDFGSINGTYVNDKRILDPIKLQEGDRIWVGKTKEFQRGVREYIFKKESADKLKQEQALLDERAAILRETEEGVTTGRKKILLRNCVFRITRRDIVAMLKSEPSRRIALEAVYLDKGKMEFLSFVPYRVGDTLLFSIENPRLTEPIQLNLKIDLVEKDNAYPFFKHTASVIRFLDKQRERYKAMIETSALISYVNCALKE